MNFELPLKIDSYDEIVVFLTKSNRDFWKMGMKNWNKALQYFGTIYF